ncbi:MAG: hypothetical protein QXY96_06990 [Candidatus Methanomethylicaceae archaeon]
MNSKERVICAIEHEEPDRIPIDLSGEVNRINVKAYEEINATYIIKDKA